MEDDVPIIYGLEFQARALASVQGGTDDVMFLVGTQSLKYDNQLHLLRIDEVTGTLNKQIYAHPAGEVWHLSCSPSDRQLFTTCYSHVQEGSCRLTGALWSLPASATASAEDTGSSQTSTISHLLDFTAEEEVSSLQWQPTDASQIAAVGEHSLTVWDVPAGQNTVTFLSRLEWQGRAQSRLSSGRWNPHHYCSQLAAACDTHVRGFDLRSGQHAWSVENAHAQLVRDLDFNPNKQYYLVTSGDDCRVKFWDIRQPSEPLKVISNHSHWVWTVRLNHFHDQLLLTSSSDWRVLLTSVASLSSEPYGRLLEEEAEEEGASGRSRLEDGQLTCCEEHEDSVYAAEWSSADPWTYASLSYDGRVVISKVPRHIKYKILL